jgi:branched-subunit amino acid ABC-type transport system permease component
LTATLFLQLAIAGVSVGAIYALVGLAIVLPFKASGVLNFGQGEIVTFGAYAALILTQRADPADRQGAGVHTGHRHLRDRAPHQGAHFDSVR